MMSGRVDIRKVQARLALLLGILFALGLVLTIVQARTASAESADGAVSASGKSNARIILTLGTSSVNLTGSDPDCASVEGTSAYAGSEGNEGCAYAWSFSVRVLSNRAWTGTIYGQDNGAPTSDVTIADGSFRASTSAISTYSDCNGAQELEDAASPWTWESNGSRGNTFTTHYQCAILDWDDGDGTIDATIQYSV